MADGLHFYSLFGLAIASEIPLPELSHSGYHAAADVLIKRGSVPFDEDGTQGVKAIGEGAYLDVEGVARFWMEAGREMVVDAAPEASPLNLRLFILGSAFAVILHQRGLLPLHANAMVVDGHAIGFMGHPGAGKSTLAAWFHDQGFELLADDVCLVAPAADGRPMAHQGIPRLRLWREALEASGRTAGHYQRAFENMDKYTVPTTPGTGPSALPLSHLYVLEKAEGGAVPAIQQLRGVAAVEALVANTYRGGYVAKLGGTKRHLLACAALASSVPVFSASRRWGYEDFDASARLLEQHARSIIGASATQA